MTKQVEEIVEPAALKASRNGHASRPRILQIGNWPPPVCGWAMNLVALRRELEVRGWECRVMNLNENRRIPSPDYLDVQGGWDYLRKVSQCLRDGFAVHTRVNGESKKGYLLALAAMAMARLWGEPGLLTYAGGHRQTYFPAPRRSLRYWAFRFLFKLATRVYCNSEAVKSALLTSGISPEKVQAIAHFSTSYVQFEPAAIPEVIARFLQSHESTFFSYVCFRKEFELGFYAEAVERLLGESPRCGFLWVGVPEKELPLVEKFVKEKGLQNSIYVAGSLEHDLFLTLLTRCIAYIRTPLTDGVCSSVMESLVLRVPVLASNNGTRPSGATLYEAGDLDGMVGVMREAVRNPERMAAALPKMEAEDNVKKLADSIERAVQET